METPDPTTPGNTPRPALPGGSARTLVARVLPAGVKTALRRRLRGTWLFPTPPPAPARGNGGSGRRGRPARPAPVPRVVRLQVPVTAPDGTAAAQVREIVLEAPGGMYVPKRLEETGLAGYEQHSIECFMALLESAGEGAVLDIGANVGLYALLAGAVGDDREVRAFEPTPELAAVARSAALHNELGTVTVEEIALGREAGTATFFLSDRSDSSNSLAEGYRQSSRQLEVTVETLDEYCARTGIVPAVMKVDTETTEPDVLAGALGTITTHRPWILCEVLHGRRTGDLAEVMAAHGYTWYHLTGDGDPEPVQSMDGDPSYADLMYLLAPEPVAAPFWDRMRAWRRAIHAAHPGPAATGPGEGPTGGTAVVGLPADQVPLGTV